MRQEEAYVYIYAAVAELARRLNSYNVAQGACVEPALNYIGYFLHSVLHVLLVVGADDIERCTATLSVAV